MSKSLIYTNNSSEQVLTAGSTISLGNTIRRFGQNLRLNNNSIYLMGTGYYKFDAIFTITGTNAGTVVISALKDGNAIPGASATVVVASGDEVTVPVLGVIREKCCCDNESLITFVISGAAETINNASVIVEKV